MTRSYPPKVRSANVKRKPQSRQQPSMVRNRSNYKAKRSLVTEVGNGVASRNQSRYLVCLLARTERGADNFRFYLQLRQKSTRSSNSPGRNVVCHIPRAGRILDPPGRSSTSPIDRETLVRTAYLLYLRTTPKQKQSSTKINPK